jgi:hypothetical protein
MNRASADHPYTAIRRELAFDVPYDSFKRALESLLGKLKIGSSEAATEDPSLPDKMREDLASSAGPSGFSLFQTIDHGGLLTALGGVKARAMTCVFGNGLIAVEMTKHVPPVGLYVPLRLYVREIEPGRISITHDVTSATLAQFGSPEVNAVAAALDAKVDKLISDAAELAARDAVS